MFLFQDSRIKRTWTIVKSLLKILLFKSESCQSLVFKRIRSEAMKVIRSAPYAIRGLWIFQTAIAYSSLFSISFKWPIHWIVFKLKWNSRERTNQINQLSSPIVDQFEPQRFAKKERSLNWTALYWLVSCDVKQLAQFHWAIWDGDRGTQWLNNCDL